jgi:CHASE3 domain sensor protein
MQAITSLKTPLHLFARSGGIHGLRLQLVAVTVVLMVAALILMSFTLSSLKNSRMEAEITEDTMLEITTIETRMLDYEGAQYGYALSGSGIFRYRIDASYRQLNAAMNKLRHSLQEDPQQLRKYDTIVPLMQKRNAQYDYLAKPEHRGEIGSSPVAYHAEKISDDIRASLWQILKAERDKRYLNNTMMIAEAEKSYWIASGIVILAFLFGALCLVLPVEAKKSDSGPSRSN